MNIVFFGTPDFAAEFLSALYADGQISVVAVVAQPDKPVGRKQVLTPPPTKTLAVLHTIPVFQPASLKDETFADQLRALKPDVCVIVAYGKIIPQTILDIPVHGNINVHPSKLPMYRGPSPLQAAIAAGDMETAVSIMLIDDKMDHGPILAQETIQMTPTETPETLREKVVGVGAPLLVETVKQFVAGKVTPTPQNHENATFCKLLTKDDGKIDWTQPAEIIERKVRAYTPWPGTWTHIDGVTYKIHQVAIDQEIRSMLLGPGDVKILDKILLIGSGSTPIRIEEIQPEGKARMDVKSFINGNAGIDGARAR